MFQISLFKVGLVSMLFFICASNVLNYVSIASSTWGEDGTSSLWYSCLTNREKCFKENPPALIATGTALNCLSFLLIIIAQIALFWPRFKDSFALYFVIGAEIATLISLVFNSIGWFFVFYPQYQDIRVLGQQSTGSVTFAFRLGWGFWLMTPSFGCSIIAAVIGSAILGCTCVTNNLERKNIIDNSQYSQTYVKNETKKIYILEDQNDPQILRL